MYINIPKGKSPEELFEWALELCEQLNRERDTEEKEAITGDNDKKARRA